MTTMQLGGVPETMLWTLHDRAAEAKRPGSYLYDPEAVRIYDSIRYDYVKNFGRPNGSHAMRSRLFDRAVRPWIMCNPGGSVVELGCGLETQFYRCDDGEVKWSCVDLPEALDVRERFLPPTSRCRFVRRNVLDLRWMDEVDARHGVFVTAQGLFMRLAEAEVQRLVATIFERFPGVELMFDVIPVWFSNKSQRVDERTRRGAPAMLWGIDRREVEPMLRRLSPRITSVETAPYGAERGVSSLLVKLLSRLPFVTDLRPSVVHVKTKSAARL